MPGWPQLVYNKSGRGDARYDVRRLPRNERGNYVDAYGNEYDENGLFVGGPNPPPTFIEGLRGSDNMNGDQWGAYLGGRYPRMPDVAPPAPAAAPAEEPAPAAAPPANRVLDRDNPNAVAYALLRLAQLRTRGYEFDIVEGDPTATWRNASQGVAEAARAAGYENPRDWLRGRPKPRPVRPVPADFYESDAVRDPRVLRQRPMRPDVVKTRPKTKGKGKPVRRGRPLRAA